ncbi:MAG: response regulator [Chloroflexi bacterium]|nr:response regulator [Chloroflexota bacterium]
MKMVALVIDDDSLNIEVLVHLLKREGVDTLSLKYPGQLSEFMKAVEDVEVIFLDLEFPDADGFDIIKDLRNSPNLGDVPIVAYSVHISEINRARREGFDSFLGKPLRSTEFPQQLQRILNREAVWEV